METYEFAAYISVDKEYKLEGLNIWNYYWHCSDRKIEVYSPSDGQIYLFNAYEIKDGDKKVGFVAGEFSDGKVGIFTKEIKTERNLL